MTKPFLSNSNSGTMSWYPVVLWVGNEYYAFELGFRFFPPRTVRRSARQKDDGLACSFAWRYIPAKIQVSLSYLLIIESNLNESLTFDIRLSHFFIQMSQFYSHA